MMKKREYFVAADSALVGYGIIDKVFTKEFGESLKNYVPTDVWSKRCETVHIVNSAFRLHMFYGYYFINTPKFEVRFEYHPNHGQCRLWIVLIE